MTVAPSRNLTAMRPVPLARWRGGATAEMAERAATLDHQMPAHLGTVEVGSRAGMHDLAAVHVVDVVGDFPKEVQILLGQEDGMPVSITEELQRAKRGVTASTNGVRMATAEAMGRFRVTARI